MRYSKKQAETHYEIDAFGSLRGITISVHHLIIDGTPVGEWVRQSVGGFGLDRNHLDVWAAVAGDSEQSRYRLLVVPLLRILEREDLAPSVPAPE